MNNRRAIAASCRLLPRCSCWLLLAAVVPACSSPRHTPGYGKDVIVVTGTMRHLDIESGCWQFVGADSIHYEVTGSNAKKLYQEGLKAKIAVREAPRVSTTCMSGKVVELVEILETNKE